MMEKERPAAQMMGSHAAEAAASPAAYGVKQFEFQWA